MSQETFHNTVLHSGFFFYIYIDTDKSYSSILLLSFINENDTEILPFAKNNDSELQGMS